jgi:hypothetical protein
VEEKDEGRRQKAESEIAALVAIESRGRKLILSRAQKSKQ